MSHPDGSRDRPRPIRSAGHAREARDGCAIEHIELLANIVRLYRGDDVETVDGSETALKEHFGDGTYVDVPGLCKVASRAEIEAQGWSLNPGRYTGTAIVDEDDEDFTEKLEGLYEEFTRLSGEADDLRAKVDAAITGILST